MKKITITLGSNESKFTTMVSDVLAEQIFGNTVNSLLRSTKVHECAEKSEVKMTRPDRSSIINKIGGKDSDDKDSRKNPYSAPKVMYDQASFHATIDNQVKATGIEKSEQPMEKPRTLDIDPDKKYLCYYKCPDCDYSFFKMAKKGETAKCKCEKDVEFKDFIQAKYECSSCSFKGFFKVSKDSAELTELTCKGCGAPIDMKYNDDKHVYQSLNMFR